MLESPTELASTRSQHTIILTSNRDQDEIGSLFGDRLLASTAMDRVLVIEGDSYRDPHTNRRQRGNAKEARP